MSKEQEMVFWAHLILPNFLLTEMRHIAVPVIAIFTKFDDLIKQVYDMDLGMEENRQIALNNLESKFRVPLASFRCPPRAYICLESVFCILFFYLYMEALTWSIPRDAKWQW